MSGKIALEARGLHMRRALVISIAAVLFTPALVQNGNAQQRAGDPGQGRAIAEMWCSACHLVSSKQTTANADVPTFSAIAQRLPADADVLAAFIANPHPPMPNLSLRRQDIQDLLAYIATLK
jgi:mono/diheme cytochrome c family protein